MPPRPKPKAKLNALTNTGKAARPPTSPAKRSPKSKSPTRTSTPCGPIATRVGSSPQRKTLRPAASAPLPVVGLYLERAHFHPSRHRWLRADRHAAATHRKTTPNQGRALSPPFRPPLCLGRSARSPAKTRAPLHRSPPIICPALLTTKMSCFENYATSFIFWLATNTGY